MDKEKSLVKNKKEELIIPKIEINDITTLIDAKEGLEALKGDVKKVYENSLEESVRNAIKRIKKRRLFKTYDYEYIDTGFFNQCHEMNSQLVKQLFPEELKAIVYYSGGIQNINRKLNVISKENSIFLRYFFLTPINEADWERFLKEIVPVTESSSQSFFGISKSKTWVRPFEKSGYERGSGQMENMQMVPFVLEEDHIDFYIHKILDSAQDYNTEIKKFVSILSKFKEEETSPPDHLEMDVRIMNFCLKNLVKKPFSPMTGAFAIQLETATSRIAKELEEITKSLEYTASSFLNVGKKNSRDFGYLAEELGFKVKWDEGIIPKYALKEITE